MTSRQLELLAPLANPLPDLPAGEDFTEDQWAILMAIMDTFIPSIHRESTESEGIEQLSVSDIEYNAAVHHLKNTIVNPPESAILDKYLAERPSAIPRFQSLAKRYVSQYAPEDQKKGLRFILSALNTRVGSGVLTGYTTSFHKQPIAIRTTILARWRDSYLPALNGFHKQMGLIAKNLWLKTSEMAIPIAGFPAVPEGYQPGPHFEYEFLQFPASQGLEVIETDVVIVGSGCGGGVCAKNLAEAGHKVLVVEKSYYYPPSQLPMTEESAGIHLFESGGVVSSDDGSIQVVAGSTWGGGGTINWSASLQTQGFVRKEWATDRGLTFFETAEFQSCLDRVCHRMGVSADHIRHNHRNEVILEGSRKLGYHAKAVPQNTGGNEHFCGHCSLGCSSAEKQGPAVSWLPDAARAGAKFIEGFQVDHVIFDETSGTKRATGIKGKWTSRNSSGGTDGSLSDRTVREVIVKAKKVIISAGTLWSPVLLLNSGLKNWQIGRNLYLHPVNIVAGVWKEDVKPWEGGILTTVCTSFENLDGHGHGVKIEATAMMPALFLTLMNWTSGFDFKMQILKYRHSNGYISLARDRDPGRIYADPVTRSPRIDYTPSAFDRAHIMEGVIAISKMCYTTGATEIHACIQGVKPFIRDPDVSPSADDMDPGVTDPSFAAWLAELQRIGNKPPTASFACAHQMGSNRMSVREKDGVVDPKGRVWGTEGLYVSDASVFPSASGVNPMITNMAISDWISRGVSKELGGTKQARL